MAEAKLYVACHPETLLLKPFESHLNSSYHYTVTGPEILAALGGVKPDFLVTGNGLHTGFGFDSADPMTGGIISVQFYYHQGFQKTEQKIQ